MPKKGSTAARKASGSGHLKRPKTLGPQIEDLRHDAKRPNIPSGGDADFDFLPRKRKTYEYDPHLPPTLQWAGKAERDALRVDSVSLHIHQYISALDILHAVQREDVQHSLWPELSPSKQIDFYAHEVGWSNRMILGDSLVVMNSLLEREKLAGKVQCVYIDPPYGTKFDSNFQPSLSKKDVRDGDDESITREPEQIQAYRDTWELGIHSYLTYLRDRVRLAHDLLSTSGSIFLQISDENVHLARELLDETFGRENFCSHIVFRKKTMPLGSKFFEQVCDHILWYAKSKPDVKTRPLFRDKSVEGDSVWSWVQLPLGERRKMTPEEVRDHKRLPKGSRVYRLVSMLPAQYRKNQDFIFEFEGKKYPPPKGSCWKTDPAGMERLVKCRRLQATGSTLNYVMFLDDYPSSRITALWDDTAGATEKIYVVQTSTTAIERCVLSSTDPGDLVLDPTCGSGTTAAVAEQWGRRWITCDTSRVALALARQRLLTARFPYFRLRSSRVRDGFVYRHAAHVSLETITNCSRVDAASSPSQAEKLVVASSTTDVLYNEPEEDSSRVRVSGPFTVEAIPVAARPDANGLSEEAPPSSQNGNGRASSAPADFLAMMIDLVKRTGIRFPNKQHLSIPTLRPIKAPYEYLHAEGESDMEGDPRRIAVSFGSQHAPVTPFQVRDAVEKARGYDIVLFVGFGCDPEARRMMEAVRGREVQFVHAAPDILINDLLRTKKTSSLFTVFGSPDLRVRKERDGQVTLELAGVDLYDPITGNTTHGRGEDVAAWFVDQNYDGRTFCISQALFPARNIKDPWEKLQKALKGRIDEAIFETLRGTESLPFKPGKKVAVAVIDDRGNEVMKLVELAGV